MPRHGSGIEHITLFGVEFTGILKLASDVTYLYDPPLRRAGVHVTKDGVRIESAARRRTTRTATACSIPACRRCTAAASTASSSTSTAACIERVVGIGETIKRIGKQMVLIHL